MRVAEDTSASAAEVDMRIGMALAVISLLRCEQSGLAANDHSRGDNDQSARSDHLLCRNLGGARRGTGGAAVVRTSEGGHQCHPKYDNQHSAASGFGRLARLQRRLSVSDGISGTFWQHGTECRSWGGCVDLLAAGSGRRISRRSACKRNGHLSVFQLRNSCGSDDAVRSQESCLVRDDQQLTARPGSRPRSC
jgi:hypothetical protein